MELVTISKGSYRSLFASFHFLPEMFLAESHMKRMKQRGCLIKRTLSFSSFLSCLYDHCVVGQLVFIFKFLLLSPFYLVNKYTQILVPRHCLTQEEVKGTKQ
jgi:hypothetical protein